MIIHHLNYDNFNIGNKAGNLFRLIKEGYQIPRFCCVNEREGYTKEELEAYLKENFPNVQMFSVRSSSSAEDGTDFSFAGQFQTFLRVKREDIYDTVKKVLDISSNHQLIRYCQEHGQDKTQIQMTAMIQEMVEADYSGVLFTANPQGILNETVVVLGKGTGDNVVEDKTETTTYYYNTTDRIYYYEQEPDAPILAKEQLDRLLHMASGLRTCFEMECDIEFAIKSEEIYLLQVRPITTVQQLESPIILDNSNIVESYPGITLPLTQSFIKEAYYKVFRSLLVRLTKDAKSVESMDEILQNMVDVANGRVYYRISNWYDVLLLLPFSSYIIPIWQEMMGVQNKTVSSNKKKKISIWAKLKTACSFVNLLFTNTKKMDWLEQYFTEILAHFEQLDIKHADTKTLLGYYKELEKMVTEQWDITLVNDMYSFLFTGMLKGKLKKSYPAEYEIITKQYISHIADIESLKPIRGLDALSKEAREEGIVKELKALSTNEETEQFLQKDSSFCRHVKAYISRYGDRNMEELKLESKTFRTDPLLLIQKILQSETKHIEPDEKKEDFAPLKGMAGLFARKAAIGIRNRESSRMNRSRLYGMMRSLMLRAGENMKKEGLLDDVRDVFWLFYEEIEALSLFHAEEQTAKKERKAALMKTLAERKLQYKKFEKLPAYSRLIFSDLVFHKNPVRIKEMEYEKGNGSYTGVACSGGVVEGEVMIVDKPDIQMDTKGKILVTKMTDPGWVFLIADAKGIVAEKGSLLSHTAIISRELKKTAVVGVTNITKILRNGDIVRVDGENGTVMIMNKKEEG